MVDHTTVLTTTLTCPACGYEALEVMPTDACQFFYDCRGCGAVLWPKSGDCCVFCSYGSVPCAPVKEAHRRSTPPSSGGGCCG